MAGLMLMGAFALFVLLLIWISGLLTRGLPISSGWKSVLRVLVVIGAFPLMIADEIFGKRQFDDLCELNGSINIDLNLIRGRRISIHDDYFHWMPVTGSVIPIEKTTTIIKDEDTGQVLQSLNNYRAAGGWLSRNTPISMGSSRPILFGGATCDRVEISRSIEASGATLLKN
jgi:hypothetical protein